MLPRLALFAACLAYACARADGPTDNIPDKVRPIPHKGVAIPEKDRAELTTKAAELRKAIDALPAALKGKPALLRLLPDVVIFHKAVDWALRHNEFFATGDVALARKALEVGLARAKQLREGKPAWATQSGLVVRGYVSRIDGSVQPYGLVVPAGYNPAASRPYRLDVWLHGRIENVTELRFIDQRMKSPGQFTPPGAFVLHPFGRFSNAFKLAGEVDVLEALAHAQRHYRIDEDRLVMRGFSMGGAGCWQMASHFPSKWVAAAPGAGFSETPLFLKVFQKEKLAPTWYEQKLWQLYDSPFYALNYHNLPLVAYSGENDSQKQAADVMEKALAGVGISMVHIIGKGAKHHYTPATIAEINRRIGRIAAKGRPRVPKHVRFTTPTLRYNECYWVRVERLIEHWKPATVDASITDTGLVIKTENVSRLTLQFGPGDCPFDGAFEVAVDGGRPLKRRFNRRRSDGSDTLWLDRGLGTWSLTVGPGSSPPGTAEKGPGLQGPIDDAFLSRFLIVRPTGKPTHEKTGAWAKAEMDRAIREWRRQFRGDALVKDDRDVTEADIKESNLILWGDAESNSLIAKVLPKLPLKWDAKALTLAGKTHDASTHVPALIYPNPLNQSRYVVLNSGFTYREYDYLNNARQNAKLPDWAVIDVRTKPDFRWPGKVADADFFDEKWQVKPRKE